MLYFVGHFMRKGMLLLTIASGIFPSFSQRIDGFYQGDFSGRQVLMELKLSDDLIVGTVQEKLSTRWYFSATLQKASFAGSSTIGLPFIAAVRALFKNDTLWVIVETPDSLKTGAFVKVAKRDRKELAARIDPGKSRDPNLFGKWICIGGTSPKVSDQTGSYRIYHPDGIVGWDIDHLRIRFKEYLSKLNKPTTTPMPMIEETWWTEGNKLFTHSSSELMELNAHFTYQIKNDTLAIAGGRKNYTTFYIRASF
jgi:hypothetical protein